MIYRDLRFWRIAPLAATGLGTSFSLQGLWAAPWLTDVAGLDRPAIVEHLTLMAAVLAASALLLGALAERLRRAGIPTEFFLAGTLALSVAAQVALLLGLSVSSYLLFGIIATGGATAVLSFAILARYFPSAVAGRANAALGVLNMGTAFALQCLSGLIIAQWPAADGHYPAEAHQAAMAAGLGLQLIGLGVFFAPKRQPQPMPMNSGRHKSVRRRSIHRNGPACTLCCCPRGLEAPCGADAWAGNCLALCRRRVHVVMYSSRWDAVGRACTSRCRIPLDRRLQSNSKLWERHADSPDGWSCGPSNLALATSRST